MKLSQEYFEARSQAMKWLAQPIDKRNFAAGLQILRRSGYKPNIHTLLLRKGEQAWTTDKLTSCLRDVIQVYYNPDDPRFDDVPDVDDLNDRDGEHQSVSEQTSVAKVADTVSFKQMPEVMQLVIKAYADAYKQRSKLARQRTEIGEANDDESVEKRKTIGIQMDQLTSYMDALAPLKEAYDRDGTVPDRAALDSIKTTLLLMNTWLLLTSVLRTLSPAKLSISRWTPISCAFVASRSPTRLHAKRTSCSISLTPSRMSRTRCRTLLNA